MGAPDGAAGPKAASPGLSVERINELNRTLEERAKASGRRPGEMDAGADNIVIRLNPKTGLRQADILRWGFIPHWAADQASPHLHARSETIAELPTFKDAFTRRRCLIPASHFVERRSVGHPRGKEYAFGMVDHSSLFMAGIWEAWCNSDTDQWLSTFAVITTQTNDMVGAVHDRMPALLVRSSSVCGSEKRWRARTNCWPCSGHSRPTDSSAGQRVGNALPSSRKSRPSRICFRVARGEGTDLVGQQANALSYILGLGRLDSSIDSIS
jgi:putative SOS response-associated peptidase YedK